MADAAPIPDPWNRFYVGRIVRGTDAEGNAVQGVVKYFDRLRISHKGADELADELGVPVGGDFRVHWDDGTQEVVSDADIDSIATQRFCTEEWVHEKVVALQAVRGGWPPRSSSCR